VAVADELVLSKTDLDTPQLDALQARLRRINPGAGQQRSTEAKLRDSLDVYDPSAKPEQVLEWLNAEAVEEHGHGHHHHDVNRHSQEIGSFVLSFDEPLHWEHVAAWLDALVLAHADDLLRVKGILDIQGQAQPIVVQAVQRLFHPPARLAEWPRGERRSRIVFITRGLTRAFVSEVFDTIRKKEIKPEWTH
jgi:G3E family GTPase